MENIVLPNTSLCAIVRDELMNPAKGIIDFVESTVPFVEQAVIVDTGSLDGTREVLEELESKYSNLKIFDRKFYGYASSRNYSLSKVNTERILVLDADERLTKEDFAKLKKLIEENKNSFGFNFRFVNIFFDLNWAINGHNPRLFKNSLGIHYSGDVWECLFKNEVFYRRYCINTNLRIKHFMYKSFNNSSNLKLTSWYRGVVLKGKDLAPSQVEGFEEWKKYNPRREEFR